jgi:hypothetical protein
VETRGASLQAQNPALPSFRLGLGCPPTPNTQHPHYVPRPRSFNTFLFCPAFSLLIPSSRVTLPHCRLIVSSTSFIPYPSRWNLVVHSFQQLIPITLYEKQLLLELELSIFSCGLCPGHRSLSTNFSLLASLNAKEALLLFSTLKSIALNSLHSKGLCRTYNTCAKIAVKGGKRVDTPTSAPIRYI